MSYVVLSRKLRPSRFGDLIGQETVAETLRNAVFSDRVAHAYLFAGSRGVGKTSAARILTKAINCLNSEHGDPCNICENCTEINQNSSSDVYEIDAASNRGIENIRELRENVNYVPAKCRYKVYIIDEAHMLTLESFNALLKTLEEPPPYVKFIFATTDPYKIPLTILSRCQRYDFLRIPIKKMADFLENVIKNESLEMSHKAIKMICRNSVGGMRDALTAVDQILSFTGSSATDQEVAQILGILDSESRFAFIEAILKKNDSDSLIYFQKLQEHGHDVNDILSDLLQTIKTIALIRSLGTSQALFQEISDDDLDTFFSMGKIVSADELQQIFQILLELEERMKRSEHPKLCFEMAILQIASIEPLVGLPEIIEKINNLQRNRLDEQSNSQNADSLLKNPEEESGLRIDNSKTNEQHSFAMSGGGGGVMEETKLKNILQSEEDVSIASESATYNESISKKEKIVSNPIKCNFIEEERFGVEEERFNVEEERFNVEEERLNVVEEKLNVVETTKNHLKVEQTKKSDKKLFLKNDSIKKLSVEGRNEETSMEPSKQWYNFSDEVQKKSSKLASFIRNAIPQNLTGTQLILTFKSGNYASMLTEENRKTLEKIVSDYIGYSIHVCCENIPRSVSQLTIVEHEQMLFEEKKEIKLKNARAFPQVKNILSVFTNSKITNIELLDVKDNLNYNN